MTDFVVEEVKGTRPGSGDWAHMQTITFRAKGEPLELEWFTKKETAQPTVGETLSGTTEPKNYNGRDYLKFKKAQAGGWSGQKPDPKKDARITRQHSQEMSLRTLELAHKLGVPLPKCEKVGELVVLVRTVAALYDNDAYAAGEAAK